MGHILVAKCLAAHRHFALLEIGQDQTIAAVIPIGDRVVIGHLGARPPAFDNFGQTLGIQRGLAKIDADAMRHRIGAGPAIPAQPWQFAQYPIFW